MPLTWTSAFLSPSMISSRTAGGWLLSVSLTSPEAFSSIGVCFVFEMVVGLKPPFAVNSRLPTFTVTGVSPPAAPAMPTAATASRAPTAVISATYLRMSLLFGRLPSHRPRRSELVRPAVPCLTRISEDIARVPLRSSHGQPGADRRGRRSRGADLKPGTGDLPGHGAHPGA